jgi:hypothetical protein
VCGFARIRRGALNQPCRPLVKVLAEIPAVWHARGRRSPLAAELAPARAAMLCGDRSDRAIPRWGRNDGAAFLEALGLPRATAPCAATLYCERLEAALGQWAEAALAAAPPVPGESEGLGLDGTTPRGSRKEGVIVSCEDSRR